MSALTFWQTVTNPPYEGEPEPVSWADAREVWERQRENDWGSCRRATAADFDAATSALVGLGLLRIDRWYQGWPLLMPTEAQP